MRSLPAVQSQDLLPISTSISCADVEPIGSIVKHRIDAMSFSTAALRYAGRFRQAGGELRSCPDPVTISIKDDGYRNQESSNATKKRAGPVDSKSAKHVHAEQWEYRPSNGSQERIGGNG